MRALLIEDNPKLADALQRGLRENGITVDAVRTGCEGEELATSGGYDIILLDLMLPDKQGVEVCRNMRKRGVTSRVMMVTALNETASKVGGLESGADDYLTKPFEFDELLARLKALVRRNGGQERHLRCDDLELDLYTRVVKRNGWSVALSNREFGLLEYLMRNMGRVVSRTQIGEAVWDLTFEPLSNVVDVYVSSLRKKVERGGSSVLIHTVRGTGYRFGQANVAD